MKLGLHSEYNTVVVVIGDEEMCFLLYENDIEELKNQCIEILKMMNERKDK